MWNDSKHARPSCRITTKKEILNKLNLHAHIWIQKFCNISKYKKWRRNGNGVQFTITFSPALMTSAHIKILNVKWRATSSCLATQRKFQIHCSSLSDPISHHNWDHLIPNTMVCFQPHTCFQPERFHYYCQAS